MYFAGPVLQRADPPIAAECGEVRRPAGRTCVRRTPKPARSSRPRGPCGRGRGTLDRPASNGEPEASYCQQMGAGARVGSWVMSVNEQDLLEDLQDRRQRVDTDFFDLSLRELVRMVEEDELQARPEYQRKFRWTESTQRELIESLLMGLPIPAIFVATNANGSWDVVDGLQRVSTIVRFMGSDEARQKLAMGAPLILKDLPQLRAFEGIAFTDLPRQIKFLLEKRYVRVQVLSDQSVHEVRFELFRRLNAGAIALSPQEVRTVLYRGHFNALLEELADYPNFRTLVKLKKPDQENGTYAELVLKFFAYLDWQDQFSGAVASFLNEYMESRQDEHLLAADEVVFKTVCDELVRVLNGPVKRTGVAWTPQNQLEGVMVAAGRLVQSGVTKFKPKKGWLDDATLVEHSTKGTNTTRALNGRVGRAEELLNGATPEKS